LHAARSSRLVETFLLLDLRTFFPFLNFSTFFSSPLLLAITFQFSAISHGRQTLPLLPLLTLLHFACHLLSVVAKVISSVFCSSFRGEHISLTVLLFLSLSVSLFLRSLYTFFLQRLAFLSIVVQAKLLRNPLSFL